MFTIYTKANRLMSANQFNIEGKSIICNDVNLPENIEHSYNPHNVRMWLIGHYHGPVCAIFASNEQDALDAACDANMMESFMLSEDDAEEYYELPEDEQTATHLGNAGELHNLDDCWIAEVDFEASRDIKLIIALVRAPANGDDTLDKQD